jgi:hypothetical protein
MTVIYFRVLPWSRVSYFAAVLPPLGLTVSGISSRSRIHKLPVHPHCKETKTLQLQTLQSENCGWVSILFKRSNQTGCRARHRRAINFGDRLIQRMCLLLSCKTEPCVKYGLYISLHLVLSISPSFTSKQVQRQER